MIRTAKGVGYINGTTQCGMELQYDSDEPFEITMVFDDETVWHIGRELLDAGIIASSDGVGVGDVRIRRGRGYLSTAFRTPDGAAFVVTGIDWVERFILNTYVDVPAGTERMDIDAEIAELLNAD